MSRPARITIDLAALQHNLQQVRKFAPGISVMGMVKSNAYGHGIERIATALTDIDALGVASLDEGMLLRKAGITKPIVLLEGLFSADELALAISQNFTLVVHHAPQVEMLEKMSQVKNPISVWMKLDTGMHRLGFAPKDFAVMFKRLQKCQAIKYPIGFMTHLASADKVDSLQTQQQITLFEEITRGIKAPRTLANSAGIISWPAAHGDWVRPGIMLYGASPFSGYQGVEHQLQPVMTLSSELIAVHHLAAGEPVGYSATWRCPQDMRIGIVGIGYGDGYPRHVKSGAPVLVNGEPCPLIGRVAMDMLTVDLRTQPAAKVGDPVVLWGAGLPVEVISEYSETTAYELLTRITQRVRVVVKTGAVVDAVNLSTPSS